MAKLKVCSSCSKETVMWKAKTKTNGALCKRCYLQSGVNGKERKDKPIQKPIKPISDKKALELKEYRKLRDEYFKNNPVCEFPDCQSRDIQLHHSKGRVGSLLTDVSTFRSLCDKHHRYVELNPIEAKKLGLSASRLDK